MTAQRSAESKSLVSRIAVSRKGRLAANYDRSDILWFGAAIIAPAIFILPALRYPVQLALACCAIVGLFVLIRFRLRAFAFVWVVSLLTLARSASTFGLAGVPFVLVALPLLAFGVRHEISLALKASAQLRVVLSATLVWCALTLYRLWIDLPQYGALAVRDSLIAFEFLAVPIGAGIAIRLGAAGLGRAASAIVVVIGLYSLIYPFRQVLPTALADITDFGNIGVSGVALLAYGLWVKRSPIQTFSLVCACVAIVVSQGRMIYLVTALVILASVTLRLKSQNSGTQSTTSRLVSVLMVALIGLGTIGFVSQIPSISGRLGTIGLSSIGDQFSSVLSSEKQDQGSVGDRRRWWASIEETMSENPAYWIKGQGLGPDLVGGFRTPTGELVRKPHNDYLETWARFGFVGAAALALLVLTPIRSVFRMVKTDARYALFPGWACGALATAYAQPYLSYPHGVIPFALITGAALATSSARSGPSSP